MTFGRLPPVRRSVPLHYSATRLRSLADGRRFSEQFVGSGTQALALAVRGALQARQGRTDVILPAYGCPDLVAATIWAGGRPVLVDIRADAWGYNFDLLRAATGPSTAAIVGVNLLGVGDQAAALRAIADEAGAALIQDSAQYLPRSDQDWCGDYVIFSFGRGKPLNLLGGGVLLMRASDPPFDLEVVARSVPNRLKGSMLGAMAFNILTRPIVFGMISALPGLSLGATEFHLLTTVVQLDRAHEQRIRAAYEVFSKGDDYTSVKWRRAAAKWAQLGIRIVQCDGACAPDDAQRLRLPLLAPTRTIRDRIVDQLESRGLGASRMYERALNEVKAIPEMVAQQGPFPAASDFASRFFTLPTHSLVRPRHVEEVDAVIASVACSRL